MKKSLFQGFVIVALLSILIFGAIFEFAFNTRQISETKKEVLKYASLIAKEYDNNNDADVPINAFADILINTRISIISADGTVLGDSVTDHRSMENYLNRTEIIKAETSGFGSSVQNSETIGNKMVNAAVKTADGKFIRISKEVSGSIGYLLSSVPSMIFALVLSLLLAAYIAKKLSFSFLTPIVEISDSITGLINGSEQLEQKKYQYSELEDMASKINVLSTQLKKQISNIQHEKDKLIYFLDNVNEGFLLLDEKSYVLLMNSSACSYLNCDKSAVGKHILHATRNYNFLKCAENAILQKEKQFLDLAINEKTVESTFTYIGKESGFAAALIITMNDVTESRKAVKIRREFFSNASHELKTPITSIKGTAELLCSDLPISDSQKKELLTRIGVESERMSMLINDIIMISRLESGDLAGDFENIDISNVLDDCLVEIEPMVEQDELLLNIDKDSVLIFANRKDIRGLVSNLLVNAVKYNIHGGSVDIYLKQQNNEAVLKIRNDGDPIPAEHQKRVFERFYRVDSGRSKDVGGTGLGLSIVKHIVDSLNGTVSLESNIDNGTTFTVRLPISN